MNPLKAAIEVAHWLNSQGVRYFFIGGEKPMSPTMAWRMRNDPWLDNGLELFGQIVEDIAGQFPQVVQVQWQPDELGLTIHNERRFVELLDDKIEQRIKTTVFYTTERQGKRREVMKPFVGFNQQPRNQHPLVFQNDRRREFLEGLFSTPQKSRRDKGCPLCGETIDGDGQDLTLSVYPFVTKIKSLSGIRTVWDGKGLRGWKEYLTVCSRCYFLGALVWMDDALLYLCDIGGTDGTAVILLPAPTLSNLVKLRRLKTYREALKPGERRTNVRFKRRPRDGQSEEEREVQEGRYSLLLAFLERTLDEIAQRGDVTDLFEEARRQISDGWLFVTIPQGQMKNIMAYDLVLDEAIMKLLVQLTEQGKLPFAHMISEMWLTNERGQKLGDETSALHESLSEAILTDNFDLFARVFIPKPRRQIHFYSFTVGDEIETLVRLWRWSNMNAETLEVVKKAGRALAAIASSRNQPVLLYQLERVRSTSDLLEVLAEGVHRLIGLEAEEMQYISLDALEQFTELVHQTTDARQFANLKNTLIVFAGIAYAKNVMAQLRTTSKQ